MDLPKIDGGFVAAVAFILAGIWGALMSLLSLKSKVDTHQMRLDSGEKKMEEIEAHMDDAHKDLKDTAVRTEAKLDRLIERFLPPHRGE